MSNSQLKFPVVLRNGIVIDECQRVNQILASFEILMLTNGGQDVYRGLITGGRLNYSGHIAEQTLKKLDMIDIDGNLFPDVASIIHATAFFSPMIMAVIMVYPVIDDCMYYDPLQGYSPS